MLSFDTFMKMRLISPFLWQDVREISLMVSSNHPHLRFPRHFLSTSWQLQETPGGDWKTKRYIITKTKTSYTVENVPRWRYKLFWSSKSLSPQLEVKYHGGHLECENEQNRLGVMTSYIITNVHDKFKEIRIQLLTMKRTQEISAYAVKQSFNSIPTIVRVYSKFAGGKTNGL